MTAEKRPCIPQGKLCGPKAAKKNICARWWREGYFWGDLSCYGKMAETWMYLSWICSQCSLLSSGICIILVHLLIKFKLHFLPESVAVVSLGKFLCQNANSRGTPDIPCLLSNLFLPHNYFCSVTSHLKSWSCLRLQYRFIINCIFYDDWCFLNHKLQEPYQFIFGRGLMNFFFFL